MNRRLLEVETIALTIFAAVPLYAAGAVSIAAIASFHAALSFVALAVLFRKEPPGFLAQVMKVLAIFYFVFFPFDAIAVSRTLVGASTHLLFFIAFYQAVDPAYRVKDGQRLLVTFLIFITSVATSTSLPIVVFIIAFTFLAFRELMRQSHETTVADLGGQVTRLPSRKAAAFYVIPTALIAAMLFPVMPRARSPFVRGLTGALPGTATGLSEMIDFSVARTISPDPEVVARVWMPRDAMPFFTPLRLRGNVYDTYENQRWIAGGRRIDEPLVQEGGVFRVARPVGFTRSATIQQRVNHDGKLYLPQRTYAVSGLTSVIEAPARGMFRSWALLRANTTYDVRMSRDVLPARPEPPAHLAYASTPAVEAMAREIIGDSTHPKAIAAKIESHMAGEFEYVADPAALGRAITVEEFLLRERRGHCEYFAAGMVVLLNSVGVPARIVGGFYGGDLNPLTGYFVVRKRDAHAWVEVFDGQTWVTFDPTPSALRPGDADEGLIRAYVTALSDSVNYVWDRYILTFGLGDQIAMFASAIDRARGFSWNVRGALRTVAANVVRPAMIAAVIVFLAAAAALIVASRRRRPLFDRIAEVLARSRITVGPAMTPEEIVRAVRANRPDLEATVRPLIDLYVLERFGERPPTAAQQSAARRALGAIRAARRPKAFSVAGSA
jgi:transglutaminase-like putative cysteine protease